MELGNKTQQKCKYCGTWNVYVCGMQHRGLLGATNLICKQCNKYDGIPGLICNHPKHPTNKPRWDV